MDNFHICITGAGVVGLSLAYQLSKSSNYKQGSIVLLDAENSFGTITSSRNSEVIHAGIYYAENSLKAKFCVKGKDHLYSFLERHKIPFKRIGKLIVSQEGEEGALAEIQEAALKNTITDLKFLKRNQLQEILLPGQLQLIFLEIINLLFAVLMLRQMYEITNLHLV